MNRVCIALVTMCLASSHLSAQRANVRGGGIAARSRRVGARSTFSRSKLRKRSVSKLRRLGALPAILRLLRLLLPRLEFLSPFGLLQFLGRHKQT